MEGKTNFMLHDADKLLRIASLLLISEHNQMLIDRMTVVRGYGELLNLDPHCDHYKRKLQDAVQRLAVQIKTGIVEGQLTGCSASNN